MFPCSCGPTVMAFSTRHGRPQKFFQPGEGKIDILLILFMLLMTQRILLPLSKFFQSQMDVHKTLYPFCATKKMPNVTATVVNSVPYKKILH